MYRHVDIHISLTIRSIDEGISNLSQARGVDVWRWMRTFFVDIHQSSNELIPIFMRTVNLIEVDIHTRVSSEVLVTLRQCCPSLRSLKVWIDTKSHGAMAQVGLFKHIQQLCIVTAPSVFNWTQSMDPMADVPPWNMPAVTHLCWQDPWGEQPHEASFISRCRFPHLTHLEIQLPNANINPHICHFLDVHRNMRSLRILGNDEWHLTIVPFSRARDLEIYCGHRPCPPRAFVRLLRPEVKTLKLELSSFYWESHGHALMTSLQELLTQFAAENDTPSTLDKIYLHVPESPALTPTTKNGLDLGALRSHIPPLNACGIRVFVGDCEICV
jgi:hypothetical protein